MTGPGAETIPGWVRGERLLAAARRLTVFCGGYGSGKTEVAVNFALHLAKRVSAVHIADLDIVNPYFRSREVRDMLESHGIEVLVPEEALVNADLPVVKPEIKGAIESGARLVLDLGGDVAGARVMASMADALVGAEYDALLVVNSRRPFTSTPDAVRRMMGDIAASAMLRVTGLVVNSHLVEQTDPAVIDEGIRLSEQVSVATGVPIAFVTIQRRLLDEFDAEACRYPVMLLERWMLKPWEEDRKLGSQKFKL